MTSRGLGQSGGGDLASARRNARNRSVFTSLSSEPWGCRFTASLASDHEAVVSSHNGGEAHALVRGQPCMNSLPCMNRRLQIIQQNEASPCRRWHLRDDEY